MSNNSSNNNNCSCGNHNNGSCCSANANNNSNEIQQEAQNELDAIRKEMDELDTKLVALLEKRMGISSSVADVKKKYGMKVFDVSREDAILNAISSKLEDKNLSKYVKNIYSEIFSNSRSLQQDSIVLEEASHKKYNINDVLDSLGFDINSIVVAYQGIEGGYGHEACQKVFGDSANMVNKKFFDDVLLGVHKKEIDFAVLPVENTSTGSVNDVLDILMKYNAYIVGELYLDINHALLGTQNSSIENIREVLSHPQALSQCSIYIKSHGFDENVSSNTAFAAKTVAAGGDDTVAAIGSIANASIYGLKVLDKNIENMKGNQTRFIVVTSASNIKPSDTEGRKISICFTLPHEKYSLVRALRNLEGSGINMSSIVSRPSITNAWQYYFYVDMIANFDDTNIMENFNNFRTKVYNFVILGHYDKIL